MTNGKEPFSMDEVRDIFCLRFLTCLCTLNIGYVAYSSARIATLD